MPPIRTSQTDDSTLISISFCDVPPPLVDAPRIKKDHRKKKAENHIPRPPNAFILFRSSFIKSQHVSTEVETNHSTLSKIIGLTWQNLPEQERRIWHAKARDVLEEHRRKFPKYAFRPLQTRAKGGGGDDGRGEKRRVREVEPKDMKRCAKIAELLVEGKTGAALDAAIQEFDKHHVPQIVTRFEPPMTARAYRRLSSAPPDDTDKSRAGQTFLLQEVNANGAGAKPRAASSVPIARTYRRLSSAPLDETQRETANGAKRRAARPERAVRCPTEEYPVTTAELLDFSSFSFDNVAPAFKFECDRLLDDVQHEDPFSLGQQDMALVMPAPFSCGGDCLGGYEMCSVPPTTAYDGLYGLNTNVDVPFMQMHPEAETDLDFFAFMSALETPFCA